MSAIESAISPFPSGSGRFQDWLYPSPDGNRVSNANVLNISSRIGLSGSSGGWSDNGGPKTFTIRNGVPCVQLREIGATSSLYNNNVLAYRGILQKGHGVPQTYNDEWSWRYLVTMAFDSVPGVGVDYGAELIFASDDSAPRIIKNGVGGIGWVRRAAGDMALIVNGGLGLQQFPVTLAGFDPTIFHTYEWRINSATQAQEATLKAFVDGTLFQSFSWGAGTILPSYQAAYRQAGLLLVDDQRVNGTTLYVYAVELAKSSSEQGTL